MIEEALYAYLTAVPALAALIGDRLYPDRAQQAAVRPFLVMTRVHREPWRALAANMGVEEALIQFDVWADTATSRNAVTDLLYAAIERGEWTAAGVTVLDGMVQRDISSYEDDVVLYRESMDFLIQHRV